MVKKVKKGGIDEGGSETQRHTITEAGDLSGHAIKMGGPGGPEGPSDDAGPPDPSTTLSPNGERFWVCDAVRAEEDDFICITDGVRQCWISLKRLVVEPRTVRAALADYKMYLPPTRSDRDLWDMVEAVETFRSAVVASRPGWCGPDFVLPDGRVVRPTGRVDEIVKTFSLDRRYRQQGDLSSWQAAFALGGNQPLLAFAIYFALAPTLRASAGPAFENLGIELVGDAHAGKGTWLTMMMSVWAGEAEGPCGGAEHWHATQVGVEKMMLARGDMPLGLNEFSLLGSGKKARDLLVDTIFMIGEGAPKAKDGADTSIRPVRLLYASTANTSLRQVLDSQGAREAAARDRLLTLSLFDRPSGIFNDLPDGFRDLGELSDRLKEAANNVWGSAGPAFLGHLVEQRIVDEAAIAKRLQRSVEWVQNAARGEALDLTKRAVKFLGLIHAAGVLAQKWGVVPEGWVKPNRAMREVLRSLDLPRTSAVVDHHAFVRARMARYAVKHAATIVGAEDVPTPLGRAKFAKARGFWTPINGQTTLVIPAARFRRAFRDKDVLAKALLDADMLLRDRGKSPKLTKKAPRALCHGRGERAYFIKLDRPKRSGKLAAV